MSVRQSYLKPAQKEYAVSRLSPASLQPSSCARPDPMSFVRRTKARAGVCGDRSGVGGQGGQGYGCPLLLGKMLQDTDLLTAPQ